MVTAPRPGAPQCVKSPETIGESSRPAAWRVARLPVCGRGAANPPLPGAPAPPLPEDAWASPAAMTLSTAAGETPALVATAFDVDPVAGPLGADPPGA